MKVLSLANVTSWEHCQNFWCPVSVDSRCPFCRRSVNFALREHQVDQRRSTISAGARCSGCGKTVFIWVIEPGPANDVSKQSASCIAMYPAVDEERGPIEGTDLIPASIRREYISALKVYNAKVPAATATLCRRALEGIALTILKDAQPGNKTLAAMLKEIAQSEELGRPIAALADSVRMGGNIGAHFEPDSEPDEEFATVMLNLLEYLLEYFFTIPRLIEESKLVIDRY